MKTLKDIRAKRLYLFFAEQMCDLITECNETIELLSGWNFSGRFKQIVREQRKKIGTIRLCISICEGLCKKYDCDIVDGNWIVGQKQELNRIIEFYS